MKKQLLRLAALPRSLLHLQLLRENDVQPDVILYRDDALKGLFTAEEQTRSLYLGRELRPSPGRFIQSFRYNRRYYGGVEATLRDLDIETLIIFLEGEPLERFIVEARLARNFQLWEDGLSHYVDLTSSTYYKARGIAQALCGFYPKGITQRRVDRARFQIFDRFEQKNLRWSYPPRPQSKRPEILFVGSPLVEDRLISRRAFRHGLEAVSRATPLTIRYLLHPREDLLRLQEDLAPYPHMAIEADRRGAMRHVADWDYLAYVSAVSTAILDIGRSSHSIFVPALFNLKQPAKAISRWRTSPVSSAREVGELSLLLKNLSQSPNPSPSTHS